MLLKEIMIKKLYKQLIMDDDAIIIQKQQLAIDWFKGLRNEICSSFEKVEDNFLYHGQSKIKKKSNVFVKKQWNRTGGGGGIISIMKGNVFEKVGVNISTVHGQFSKEFREQIPGAEKDGKFWASGISVVSHMTNPYVPAAHMNTRFLITGEGSDRKMWFEKKKKKKKNLIDPQFIYF